MNTRPAQCEATTTVRYDGQTDQTVRCSKPAHPGNTQHRTTVLDTDDNAIPHHWHDKN